MVDITIPGGVDSIETRDDLGTGDKAVYEYWMTQDAIAERDERKWVKRAREIVKRYRDERPESMGSTHRYNILWSNVQTLLPTLYGRTPEADVQRRFQNQDDTGRLASELLERAINYSIDVQDFDAVMKAVVQDRLLPGRGVPRVLYVPHFGEELNDEGDNEKFEETEDAPSVIDNEGDELAQDRSSRPSGQGGDDQTSASESIAEPAEPAENAGAQPAPAPLREVVYEEVVVQYVFWEDYREGPARAWKEVPWLRYRAYMTREELVERFGKKIGKRVNLDYAPRGGTPLAKEDIPPDMHKKAIVHEYWDKVKMQVVWIAPGTPDLVLDTVDDPLTLPDFYPSPDPLCATMTNDKRIPVPDYLEYQDQARELDTLTSRIDRLQRALKLSGIYPGEQKQVLQQLVDEGTENRLIPVEDWPAWADKGGLKEFIQWMPIQQVAETLIQLYDARDKVKNTLYEITGIGDIMRGNTQPTETATAQLLKTNFVTRRVQPQQKDVARLARDVIRLMGAVIAEHFSAKTISMITGYPHLKPVPQLPPPPPMPQAMAMMVHAAQAGNNVVPLRPSPSPMGQPQPGQPQQPGQAPQQQPIPPEVAQYMQQMAQWKQQQAQIQQIQQANDVEQKKFDAAVELIKSDGVHGFRLDIEADSTIAADEEADKAGRVEFLKQMVPLLELVFPMAQGNPPLAAVAKEVTLYAVRGFKAGRPLEETIEQAFDAIAQMPPAPNGPMGQGKQAQGKQQNPQIEAAKVQADVHDTDVKAQTERMDMSLRAQQMQQQAELEAQKAAAEGMIEQQRLGLQTAELAQRERFENARMESIQSRTARGLQ